MVMVNLLCMYSFLTCEDLAILVVNLPFSSLPSRWEPLEDLEDGALQMVETLREDIIQIERELAEGWLGAVSDFDAWEAKALQVRLKNGVIVA